MLADNPRQASRGQAIFETAIMMPLFMLGLFGTLWAVRESTLGERVQDSVRYAGLVTGQANTYTSYSLYSMYSTLDGALTSPGVITCTADLGTSLTSVRSAFWQPATTSTSTCSGGTSIVAGSTQNVMLQNELIGANAAAAVDGYLTSHTLGRTTTPLSAKQNFFRSPDVGTLMSCTSVGSDIKASLEGGSDLVTSITAPTIMPLNPSATSVFAGTLSCATFSPAGPQPSYTVPPTLAPTPTPTPPPPTPTPPPTAAPTTPPPTAAPTPTPVPTATPTPRPTATPTPTPAPCFNLFGIIIICPTPTPAPTATPTPTPAPTATPSPTATPCNNGNGNGHGYGNCSSPSPTPTPSPSPTPTLAPPTPTPTPNPFGTPAGGAH